MPSAVTMLCVPCAGASATMYMRWRRVLPRWIDLLPVELPGRGVRLGEPFEHDFDTLVDRLCREQAAALRGRFVLFGHSMGALLAHAVTRRLHDAQRPLPLALVVSGSPAPSRRDGRRYPSSDDRAGLIADLRRQGGTPDAVFESAELMRITLAVLGADYRLCESHVHRPGAPLPVPMHVLAGRQDDIAPERVLAWSQEAGAGVTHDSFDGGHFFIRDHETAVLDTLVQRLSASVSEGALPGTTP